MFIKGEKLIKFLLKECQLINGNMILSKDGVTTGDYAIYSNYTMFYKDGNFLNEKSHREFNPLTLLPIDIAKKIHKLYTGYRDYQLDYHLYPILPIQGYLNGDTGRYFMNEVILSHIFTSIFTVFLNEGKRINFYDPWNKMFYYELNGLILRYDKDFSDVGLFLPNNGRLKDVSCDLPPVHVGLVDMVSLRYREYDQDELSWIEQIDRKLELEIL